MTQRQWAAEIDKHPEPENSHMRTGLRKLARLRRPEPYTTMWVRGRPVGAYVLVEYRSYCRLLLIDVFVHARGRGYGRELLQHAIQTATDNGHGTMRVLGAKGARPFYEACGHIPVRSTSNRDWYVINLT
jgi:GNAT superfamily N-acetyltransferase